MVRSAGWTHDTAPPALTPSINSRLESPENSGQLRRVIRKPQILYWFFITEPTLGRRHKVKVLAQKTPAEISSHTLEIVAAMFRFATRSCAIIYSQSHVLRLWARKNNSRRTTHSALASTVSYRVSCLRTVSDRPQSCCNCHW